jgi:uncharacterized protein DUF6795
MLRFSLCVLACVALVVGLAGCGTTSDIGAASVSGTVTYNGSPVEGATVSFVPTDDAGKMAAGTTDAQGKFTLTTVQAGDGAVPGAYQVAVSKIEGGAAAGETQTEEEAYAQAFPGSSPEKAPEVKDLLPAKYKDASKSGLTATVESGGGNDFPFELKD